MKKILLIFMAIFAFGTQNVSAQDAPLKIVTNHPDFKIKVKRCAASGKTVIIDLILNNIGTTDVNAQARSWCSVAYDNEGNIYDENNIYVKVANRPEFGAYSGMFDIPTGVPMRLTVRIDNVSTEAESFARLKLHIDCNKWGLNESKLIMFSNIPISRD